MTNNSNPADYQEFSKSVEQNVSQSQPETEQARLNIARQRLSLLLPWLAVAVLGLMVARFFMTGTWQYIATSAVSLIVFAATIQIRRLIKQQRFDLAAYFMLFAVSAIFAFYSLFLSEAEWIFVVGALLFINILGTLVLPRRMWWHTLVMSLIVALVPLLTNVLPLPWQRFPLLSSENQSNAFYIIIIAGLVALLTELFFSYRRIVRIGTRLAVIFAIVVVAAVSITTLISLFVVSNATRDRAFKELETTTQLKRNSIQSWVASLQSELDTVLIEDYELTRARSVLLKEISPEFQTTAARELRTRFNGVIERNFNFTEIVIADLQGQVILSSNVAGDDKWVDYQPWFLLGQNAAYVDQPRYSLSDGGLVMVFSQPLYDQMGFKIGVIAGKANLSKLSNLVGASPSGVTGQTYLVAGNHELVGEQRYVYSEGIDAVLKGKSAFAIYDDYAGTRVLGHYLHLTEFGAGLVNEISEQEVLRTGRQGIMITNGITTILVGAIAVVTAIFVARSISRPLNGLVDVAERISAGELDLRVDIVSEDELGTLAQAFNSMTSQLRTLIANLELRVQERTEGLAAVGEVTRATTSQLDIAQLLPSVVNTVLERFNLYYVGLFLVDELPDGRQVAVLRAATGEAGETMMAQQWQIEVGMDSMIGTAIYTGQPRVRQSSTESGPWQRNPYLPDTESELALPLRFGDDVLGAMTVQSVNDNAFDSTMIDLLQNMADQVAVAIENARLFTTSQQALVRAQVVQQRYQSQSWRNYLQAKDVQGVSYSHVAGLETLSETPSPALGNDAVIEDGKLLIPIMQGSQQVGVIGFEGKTDAWQPEEIELLQALAEQLSLAAENQRLLEETRLRAAREQTLGRVADSLRQSLDVETVLSTAAGEIREALGLDRIVVRLAKSGQND